MVIALSLSVLLVTSASVKPASVPAAGKQETTLHIVKPGMYHLTAKSGQGTTCEVVDSHRGVFAQGGLLAKSDCELDLLLDMGFYLVRLRSPEKAKGKVVISLKEFIKDWENPPLLNRGRTDSTNLLPGHQVSWWINVKESRDVEIVVAGRSAGRVELWREGRWLQPMAKRQSEYFVKPGQSRYFWRLFGKLEPAGYRLVVYGVNPKKWTRGTPDESLFVSNGYEIAKDSMSREFRIPMWGFMSVKIKGAQVGVHMQLDKPPLQNVRLDIRDSASLQGMQTAGRSRGCYVRTKSLVPECVADSVGGQSHVLTVWGPAGTKGTIRWFAYSKHGFAHPKLTDDMFASMNTEFSFLAPADGKYLVGVVDVPSDPDASPLSCELAPVRKGMFGIQKKYDYVRVGRGRYLDRNFNYNGRHAGIWFRVQKPGRYSISTRQDQVKKCELFIEQSEIIRKATGCNLSLALGKGLYRMELYDGKPGIARISIKPGSWDGKTLTPISKTSCLFKGVELNGKAAYRLRMSRKSRVARGLVLRRLPLKLEKTLFLAVEPGDVLSLPIAPGDPVVVHGSGSKGLLCSAGAMPPIAALGQRCRLPALDGKPTLSIGNAGDSSMWVSMSRYHPESITQPLKIHFPRNEKLQSIKPGKVLYADFYRNQTHSVLLHVPTSGVYEVTTLGLLATRCSLRTPVFPNMFSNQAGGRGRNCLVAGYMNEGDYLFSATTVGRSMGRAGIKVETRELKKGPDVVGGGEVFFRVPAGQMLRQRLIVKTKRTYSLTTKAQGASLLCRLEDGRGWPLLEVPCSCSQQVMLHPGTYFWSQMPLTVDSRRSTSLLPVKDLNEKVMRGSRVHVIKFNNRYTIDLHESGKDRFRFSVRAPMDVTITLDRNMVGTLYLLHTKEKWSSEITTGGKSIFLSAGEYELVTRYSMDDVALRYHLELRTDVLAPGVSKKVPVPGSFPLKVGADGVVRIGTSGQKDTKCRLFDSAGNLLARSDDVGDDWNCLSAVMLPAGDYKLALETADGSTGLAEVFVSSPKTRQVGQIDDGVELLVGKQVLVATLGSTNEDVIQDVEFSSKVRFSCRLEDEDGVGIEQHLDVLRCGFLVRSNGKQHRVRLWTRRWSGKVQVQYTVRPIKSLAAGKVFTGKIPPATALRVEIPRTGRYKTGRGLYCLDSTKSGVFRSCSGQASLKDGVVIFSGKGAKTSPRLDLKEVIYSARHPSVSTLLLTKQPTWQRQHAGHGGALHLLSVISTGGDSISPLCSLQSLGSRGQGAYKLAPGACFAAAAPCEDAMASWALSAHEHSTGAMVRLARRMVRVPSVVRELAAGHNELLWSSSAARYSLPKGPGRVRVLLPLQSWAVLVDSSGSAADICPPSSGLRQCEFRSKGGELFLVSDSERKAMVDFIRSEFSEEVRTLQGALELCPARAERVVFEIAESSQVRSLEVRGAKKCWLALDDGFRSENCYSRIPPDTKGRLELTLPAAPVSIVLGAKEELNMLRWGDGKEKNIRLLPMAEDVALRQGGGTWSLHVPSLSLVSVNADSGLCALVDPLGKPEVLGDGAGCHWNKLLDAGKWRIKVRPFDHKALEGHLRWIRTEPRYLEEGTGGQMWLAPSDAMLLGFKVRRKGDIGFGIKADRDVLRCTVLDRSGGKIATGCLNLLRDLSPGDYFVLIRLGEDEKPVKFRPSVLGLNRTGDVIPDKYLREFFQRIGGRP